MSGPWAPDFFCRQAQRLGYVARSAFKLLEIQKQFKLMSAGSSVLDLGCAPGAWLQVACQSLGPLEKGGAVVGIDLKKVNIPSHHCDSRVRTICADVMNLRKDQARVASPQNMGDKDNRFALVDKVAMSMTPCLPEPNPPQYLCYISVLRKNL